MRIIEPSQLRRTTRKRRSRTKWFLLIIILVFVAGSLSLSRPFPAISPMTVPLVRAAEAPISLPWPAYGQASIGAMDYGVLSAHNDSSSIPVASVAKVITVLALLKEKPLSLNEQGPSITIAEDDVASYQNYLAQDGSTVPVELGEEITEYQALQALLLPSANNMAYTLVSWAFGSENAYVTYANTLASQLGATHTHIADASGFSALTTSNASDLVRLGEEAMRSPVFAQIVGQTEANIPVAGTIHNVNSQLGNDGIVGIKTGNTNQAGGCYLFAAPYEVQAGKKVMIIGAVLGAPDLPTAMHDALTLLQASHSGFKVIPLVTKQQVVGQYQIPGGKLVKAETTESLSTVAWLGSDLPLKTNLDSITLPATNQRVVGSVYTTDPHANVKNVAVRLQTEAPLPGKLWRWLHGYFLPTKPS